MSTSKLLADSNTLFDAHAHLTGEKLLPDVEEILARAKDAGVGTIVNICTGVQSLEAGLLLQKKHPWVWQTAATTPHDVEEEGELFFPYVERAAREGKLVAIGETGLDYCYEHSPKKVQKYWLKRYFALATKTDLPVIFHCREAFEDLFEMADREYEGQAILHCFTGTLQEARGVLERGWLISISGIATFKKSVELREIVKFVPLDSLVIETDAPYLAPQSKRGQVNEPAFIEETAQMIADVKGVAFEEVVRITRENAVNFFLRGIAKF